MSDIIDSRELLVELRELVGGDELHPDPEVVAALDEDERERVQALRDVLANLPGETVEGRHSWGVTMIPEDEFEDYARELAEDLGAIDSDAAWPASFIDWPRAAAALAQDYSEVEFDGTTYLCRD